MENHRRSQRHMDTAVWAVAMAGGNDMLRQGRAGQIESAVWISEDARALRRSDLKCGVAQPFERQWLRRRRGRFINSSSDDLDFVAKAKDMRRQSCQYQQ